MSGVKGKSGRKRNIANIQKYYNEQFDLRAPQVIERLLDEAINGKAEALIYSIDRRLGKPKITTDLNLDTGDLGKGLLLAAMTKFIEAKREYEQGITPVLIGGDYAIQECRAEEGTPERVDAEEERD